MPPDAHAPVKGKNRKAMVYAGVAAAILLVLLLARRSSSGGSSSDGQAALTPVSNPAVDPSSYYSGGTGAGGVDYGPQLATLDTDIQTMGQALASWMGGAQNPGSTTPGTAGTDPSGWINAISAGIVSGVAAGAAAATPQSQPGPGNTPAVKPPAKPKTPVGSGVGNAGSALLGLNAGMLAPGAKSPGYTLVRPAGHPNAVWAGANKPGPNYTGVGGGWWVKK